MNSALAIPFRTQLALILDTQPHKTLSAWQQLMAMTPGRKLLYFAAVPVLIGLYFGWFKADQGGQDLMVRTVLVPYWIGFFQLGWLSVILASLLGYELLKPWRPPLWVLSLVAPAAFSWLGAYVINAYIGTLNAQFPEVIGKSSPMTMDLSLAFFVNFLSFMAPNLVLFMAVNYYFDRTLSQPVYRYGLNSDQKSQSPAYERAEERSAQPAQPPVFLQHSACLDPDELLAIQAQEHFIKIWTVGGSELIRYRFGNALIELERFNGLQVHRSYWVADSAVRRLTKRGSKHYIELVNDELIPVSQSYLRQVRDRYAH